MQYLNQCPSKLKPAFVLDCLRLRLVSDFELRASDLGEVTTWKTRFEVGGPNGSFSRSSDTWWVIWHNGLGDNAGFLSNPLRNKLLRWPPSDEGLQRPKQFCYDREITMSRLRVLEVQFYERNVVLRLPFRFGVITLTEEPQAFARVRIRLENGTEGWGVSAEALAPKWFDKNPLLTNEENLNDLRSALSTAAFLYMAESSWMKPFDLFMDRFDPQILACRKNGLNSLVASFGPALLDRAILDAVCKIEQVSFFEAVRNNLPGIRGAACMPELASFDFDQFLQQLQPANRIHARHTVGLLDPIADRDLEPAQRLNDGLPETLEEVIEFYGNTYFKLKLSGDVEADRERLISIASVLDRSQEPYFATLDGNEQFDDLEGVERLWTSLEATPELERLIRSIVFIEQPIKRQTALDQNISTLSSRRPVIIDESDNDLDAFPRARGLGYLGVSSKQCKGLYKSFINAARCALWNKREEKTFFMSGEDLTTQPGINVQQDLALATSLGITHLERNGHHFFRGMADLSRIEQEAFLKAHPDLYIQDQDFVRIDIKAGELRIDSLDCVGFAAGAEPDWKALRRTR